MPSWPGMTLLPNSAPDSFTPNSLNLVRAPAHTLALGAEPVVVGALVTGGTDVGAVGDAAPGRHCE